MSPFRATRRGLLFLTAGALAVVLVAALVYMIVSPSHGCGRTMVETPTQECVGIVESVDDVDERFRNAVGKILAHNEEVARSPRYVKIALLTPMSVWKTPLSGVQSEEQVQASLEGAYTALLRANTDAGAPFGDPNLVKVQMVLANFGSRQRKEDVGRLVNDILGRGEEQHPLVAVVGLGSSLEGTQEAARVLSDKGIPMVSAVASADTLDSRKYGGLYSVSPSSTDYVLALRNLLDKKLPDLTFDAGSGLIVADENKTDSFVQGLREAFLNNLKYYVGQRDPQWFTGSTVDAPAPPNVFEPVVRNICTAVNEPAAPLSVVFYAGRVTDFKEFAERLRGRTCVNTPLAILVGATGFQVAAEYEQTLIDANVTVIYSTSTDATAWREGRSGKPAGFDTFLDVFKDDLGFGDGSLGNGYAIMYHDAVASAISAIRLATDATDASTVPVPAGVRLQLKNVRVDGASTSPLTFPDSTHGRAKDRLVVYRHIGSTHRELPPDLEPYRTGG